MQLQLNFLKITGDPIKNYLITQNNLVELKNNKIRRTNKKRKEKEKRTTNKN